MTNEINVNQDIPNIINGTFTTNQQSSDIDNPYWKGCWVYLNITQASGTGGLTVELLAKDPGSGNYDNASAIGTARTATGLYGCLIYPAYGIISDSGGSIVAMLPRTFAIRIAAGDNSSYTYSVSLSMVK
jgi:hypothetical protein